MTQFLAEPKTKITQVRIGIPRRSFGSVRFRMLPSHYLPGRALFFSVVLHAICALALLLIVSHKPSIKLARPQDLIAATEQNRLIYLPLIGGGNEGIGSPGGTSGPLGNLPVHLPDHGSPGFTYSGPQPIVSDPPLPLNRSLTLQRPGMKNLPVLKEFVSLPNLVQTANQSPAPIDVRNNKSSLPVSRPDASVPAPKVAVRAGALDLPANATDLPLLQPAPVPDMPNLSLPISAQQAAKSPLPLAEAAPPPPDTSAAIEPVNTEQLADVVSRGMERQTLVALSPLPAPPSPDAKIPMAETRGRFAVSPMVSAVSPAPSPGSASRDRSTGSTGIGEETGGPNAVTGGKQGGGNSLGQQDGIGTGGSGTGTATGPGTGYGGNDQGAGSGLADKPGSGVGAGSTSASGTGAGSGHGSGILAGITIQGGRLEGGMPPKRQGLPVSPQVAYGMTIVSTPHSGGGLPDFGVFSNERVYTVFLDTRMTTDEQSPSWTLQYAPLLTGPEAELGRRAQALSGVTPPYAVTKSVPRWPAELVRLYRQRVIIVSGVINTEGKLEQLLVMQSPDDRLTSQLTEALNSWAFRPAELNGHPISAKVMLGVPLSLTR